MMRRQRGSTGGTVVLIVEGNCRLESCKDGATSKVIGYRRGMRRR